jgi:hypothetical protein
LGENQTKRAEGGDKRRYRRRTEGRQTRQPAVLEPGLRMAAGAKLDVPANVMSPKKMAKKGAGYREQEPCPETD